MRGLRWLDAERETRRLAAMSVVETAVPEAPREDMSLGELDALMQRYEAHLFWLQGAGEYTATAFDGQTYQANGATPSAAILALVACIEGAS